MVDQEVQQHLPLTPAVFQILLALSDGPKHGYSIMKEVEQSTDSQVTMGPGTLYGSIKRMIQAKLIYEDDPPQSETDQRRRYYRLYRLGRLVLEAELSRMEKQLVIAREKNLTSMYAQGGVYGIETD